MKIFKRLAVLGLMGALVAACSSIDLDATKKMALKGDAFQKALFNEYVELARSEDAQGDSRSAQYYNLRAMMAADGKDTGPQELKARKIPSSAVKDLTAARKALTDALAAGFGKSAPADAAKAQAMFDCWMEQQEENDQPKDIAACRSAFEAAMKKAGKPAAAAPKKPEPVKFVVYFGLNKAKLDDTQTEVLYRVMGEYASKGGQVLLYGHADTSGDEKRNRKLSEKRAETVKQALIDLGVDASNIQAQFFGEDEPAEKTGDNVKNAKNRRVNISILQK